MASAFHTWRKQFRGLAWGPGDRTGLERHFGIIYTQIVFEAWELGLSQGGWPLAAKGSGPVDGLAEKSSCHICDLCHS